MVDVEDVMMNEALNQTLTEKYAKRLQAAEELESALYACKAAGLTDSQATALVRKILVAPAPES